MLILRVALGQTNQMSFLDSSGFLNTLKSPSNTAVEFIKLFLVLDRAGVLLMLPKTLFW